MKFTIATAILASSITATAGSLRNPVDDAISASHRRLAVSKKDQSALLSDAISASHRGLAVSKKDQSTLLSAVLKKRRVSKKQNGKVIHNLQNKFKRSKIRNLADEEGDLSSNLDIGAFSRDLQSDVVDFEEPRSFMEEMVALCSNTDSEFSCTCSNLDTDAYTASVSCANAQYCLPPMPNLCGDDVTFCVASSYNIEVTPEGVSSTICSGVESPMAFSYCYGLTFDGEEGEDIPSGCFLELDGNTCNSCEVSVSPYNSIDPYDSINTCKTFDCSNVDDTIGSGTICGEETIISDQIEDYMTFGSLPCEGGCNICPLGGEMANPENNVTMITGDIYNCNQLNIYAQFGYFQGIPGDMCSSLPALVNEPCGCPGGDGTVAPVVVPTPTDASTPEVESTEESADVSGDEPVDGSAEESADVSGDEPVEPVKVPTDAPVAPTASAAAKTGNNGFAIAAAVASTAFAWMML